VTQQPNKRDLGFARISRLQQSQPPLPPETMRRAVNHIADTHGLTPEDVNRAIGEEGAKATLTNTLPTALQHTPGIEN